MNFLAHCLLAHPDDELIAGGFLGDFVKGPVPNDLPEGLQDGIRLHRRIDAISNRDPHIAVSVGRLGPELRRVAPVLVDILADHCLATSFDQYAEDRLEDFCEKTYGVISRYEAWLTPSAIRFFEHMSRTDLLGRYRDPAVIVRAMLHVLERLGFERHADQLPELVNGDLEGLRTDFAGYFPTLREAVEDWKDEQTGRAG